MQKENSFAEEMEMRDAYDTQCEQLIREKNAFIKKPDTCHIGIESEIAIHTHGPIAEIRDAIVRDLEPYTDTELGVAQIEIRTPPVDIAAAKGFPMLERFYRDTFASVITQAHAYGARVLRVGANPFLPIKNSPRTNKPKYQIVPDYYNRHRSPFAETLIGTDKQINIGDAAIVSLFQSFQINWEAHSSEHAYQKMNYAFAFSPYILAACGNSRYLEYFDTHRSDMRLEAWEKSFDLSKTFFPRAPKRIGLPEQYFCDLEQYFRRAGQFPFILHDPPRAMQIAIGMTWLDARVKIIGDSLVVELRSLPTLPAIDEELQWMLFYVGRVAYAEKNGELLLPFYYIRENRLCAMHYGMRRPLWFRDDDGACRRMPYREGIKKELRRAKRGLEYLGLEKYFTEAALIRTMSKGTPSDRLAAELKRHRCENSREAIEHALEATGMMI